MPRAKAPKKRRAAPSAKAVAPVRAISIRAVIGAVSFEPGDEPGTMQYLMRICGAVHRFRMLWGVRGEAVRLAGRFVARARGDDVREAKLAQLPDAITAQVVELLRTYPARSTRDRPQVLMDFDIWARRDPQAVAGYSVVCSGRAWIPDQFAEVLQGALTRPVPKLPASEV